MGNLLVLGASAGYAFSIGTLVLNLAEVSPQSFQHLLVLSPDLNDRDKEIISELIPSEFQVYKTPLSRQAIRRSPYLRFFSPFVLAKLECFRLLQNFDSVTWLDNDVAVVKPLNSLFNFGPSGASFVPTSNGLGQQFVRSVLAYDVEQKAPAGGTFTISSKFAGRDSFYPVAVDLAEKHARDLFLPDQAVMGMTFQSLNLDWDFLDEAIFAPHPDFAPKDAVIHHPFGPRKFWSGLKSQTWERNYLKWIRLGGSPISTTARHNELKRLGVKAEIRLNRLADWMVK